MNSPYLTILWSCIHLNVNVSVPVCNSVFLSAETSAGGYLQGKVLFTYHQNRNEEEYVRSLLSRPRWRRLSWYEVWCGFINKTSRQIYSVILAPVRKERSEDDYSMKNVFGALNIQEPTQIQNCLRKFCFATLAVSLETALYMLGSEMWNMQSLNGRH